MLKFIDLPAVEETQNIMIWLHGLGANGYDFAPMMQQLNASIRRNTRCILPHAPLRPVTLNNGFVMPAWYDISSMDFIRQVDEKSLNEAHAQIDQLIDYFVAEGIAASRIFLGGFSQGCAMALYAGLSYQKSLAGIIGFSGYLPLAEQLARTRSAAQQKTPVLLAHGKFDPVVQFGLGEKTRAALTDWGYPLTWHAYPILHTVSMEQIDHFNQWMTLQLARIAAPE